jgi:hypothetical protein
LTTNDPALFATAPGNRVCRIAARASYERETVNAILDASYLCHIGFISSAKPMVIPMTYWRSGEVGAGAAAKGEIRSIALMRIKLDQVSAKVRDEYPDEETVDPDWPVWVGVIPAKLVFGAPLPNPVRNRIPVAPEHVAGVRSMDGFAPAYGTTADGQAS